MARPVKRVFPSRFFARRAVHTFSIRPHCCLSPLPSIERLQVVEKTRAVRIAHVRDLDANKVASPQIIFSEPLIALRGGLQAHCSYGEAECDPQPAVCAV